VGRRSKPKTEDFAYIAGFLDGDGSVMFQLKKRSDTLRGKRLMFTICFYQDTRHEKPLFWIRKKIGIGYISRRNDGITELRINGYRRTKQILESLYPYIQFKKKQINYYFKTLKILDNKNLNELNQREKKIIVKSLVSARKESYQSGQKKIDKLEKDIKDILGL
jgi:hypothetical protein